MGLFSSIDEFLFGPPLEIGGIIGSAVSVADEYPVQTLLVIGAAASAACLGVATKILSGTAASWGHLVISAITGGT